MFSAVSVSDFSRSRTRYLLGATMASLADVAKVVAASNSIFIFDDSEDMLSSFVAALSVADVFTVEDFRFAFVSGVDVDEGALEEFCKGDMAPCRDVCRALAEALIPEGGIPQVVN